jgi:hypothetical protein
MAVSLIAALTRMLVQKFGSTHAANTWWSNTVMEMINLTNGHDFEYSLAMISRSCRLAGRSAWFYL